MVMPEGERRSERGSWIHQSPYTPLDRKRPSLFPAPVISAPTAWNSHPPPPAHFIFAEPVCYREYPIYAKRTMSGAFHEFIGFGSTDTERSSLRIPDHLCFR